MMFQNSTLRANRWISCKQENPQAKIRLFCIPYSGASATVFYPWAETLPSAVEVCPVQLPGRGSRVSENLYTGLSILARDLAEGLSPLLNKPYALFGHSLGALLSFELSRIFRQAGLPSPEHLFVSGHNAPHLPDPNPVIANLPEAQFIQKLRELNGMAPEVLQHEELMQMVLPIIRADFIMCETYQYFPEPPLTCPISAFGGLQDPYVTRDMLDSWREQTYGPFTLRFFPGDHFYLNNNRHLLLQVIARDLSRFIIG